MVIFKGRLSKDELQVFLQRDTAGQQLLVHKFLFTAYNDVLVASKLEAFFRDEAINDGNGGMIEVSDLKVTQVEMRNDLKGKVKLSYVLDRFFACAGEENKQLKQETLDLLLDEQERTLVLELFELPVN